MAPEDGYNYPKTYKDSEFWNRGDEEDAPDEDDVSEDSEGKNVLCNLYPGLAFQQVLSFRQ
jgi:hypothetical protein